VSSGWPYREILIEQLRCDVRISLNLSVRRFGGRHKAEANQAAAWTGMFCVLLNENPFSLILIVTNRNKKYKSKAIPVTGRGGL
jgi:hypothetical protein